MLKRDVIVVGASAGGLEVLRQIVANLPADFQASVFVVLHIAPSSPGILADILDRSGPLLAAAASDGEPFEHGRIYIAPPDHHLLLEREVVRVQRGPRQNRHRPAVDPLFRSAAIFHGRRVIGVIVSGAQDDGSAGLRTIKLYGGIAIVQDPKEAMFSGMPTSALSSVAVDHCVSAAEIAPLLVELTSQPISEEPPDPVRQAGVLWEWSDAFRCHVGHSFSAETLLSEQELQLEDSLWVAVRTLEESATLKRRLAARFRERCPADVLVERVEADAATADGHARRLREVLGQLSSRPSR